MMQGQQNIKNRFLYLPTFQIVLQDVRTKKSPTQRPTSNQQKNQ